jgi:hypothetical protein
MDQDFRRLCAAIETIKLRMMDFAKLHPEKEYAFREAYAKLTNLSSEIKRTIRSQTILFNSYEVFNNKLDMIKVELQYQMI